MDFDEPLPGRDDPLRAGRWGSDHVAQIVTFFDHQGTCGGAGRSQGARLPYGVGDRIAKLMPPAVMGGTRRLWACFREDPKHADGYKVATELRDAYAADPDVKAGVDVPRGLEGLRRPDGSMPPQ